MQQSTLSPEKFFYSNDGKIFASIEDLFIGLKDMTEDTFSYHLNTEKNDFYNWFTHVFHASDIADAVKKVKTKSGFLKKLRAYISHMETTNRKEL